MKKFLITNIIISLIALLCYAWYHSSCNNFNDPDTIGHKVGISFPKYDIVSQSDNLERNASRWDDFDFTIKFSEEDTKKLVDEVRSKGWKKSDSYYYKIHGDPDKDGIQNVVYIYPTECTARISSMVDEDYVMFPYILYFLLYRAAIIFWGIFVFAAIIRWLVYL